MGEAKRLRDKIKAEQERSEREDKLHKRTQRAEGDLIKAQAESARLRAEVKRLRKLTLTLSMERHIPAMHAAQETHKQQAQATDDYMALLEQFKTSRNDTLQDASDVEMILEAMMSVHDMDVTLADYAKAVSEAILTLKRT